MGSPNINLRYLVLLALASPTLTACSGGEQPAEPVAPYANYQPSDAAPGEEAGTEGTTPNDNTSNRPDFLADPRSQEDVLADATLNETDAPQTGEPAPQPAPQPAPAAGAEADPLADLLGEPQPQAPASQPSGDRYAAQPQSAAPQPGMEPAPAAPLDDDLFADDPQPQPAQAPAAQTPPADNVVTGDPLDEAMPQPTTSLASQPQQPARNPLDELFGDDDPAGDAAMPADNLLAPDPDTAMTQFINAMRAGNLEAANQQVLTPSAPERQELVRKQVAKMAESLIEGTLEFELVQTRVDGNWALAVAHLTIAQNGQSSERISEQYMVLHDGQWKVVPETIRDDPAVLPLLGQSYSSLRTWYQQQKPDFERRHLQTLLGGRP